MSDLASVKQVLRDSLPKGEAPPMPESVIELAAYSRRADRMRSRARFWLSVALVSLCLASCCFWAAVWAIFSGVPLVAVLGGGLTVILLGIALGSTEQKELWRFKAEEAERFSTVGRLTRPIYHEDA